jgi:hypothetical protein
MALTHARGKDLIDNIRYVELMVEGLGHADISVRLATVDILLVFLTIIDDLRQAESADDNQDSEVEKEKQEEEEGGREPMVGQYELFQLASGVEPLIKARDRRASKEDNKRLRRMTERLLALVNRLRAPVADRSPDEADEVCRPHCLFRFGFVCNPYPFISMPARGRRRGSSAHAFGAPRLAGLLQGGRVAAGARRLC